MSSEYNLSNDEIVALEMAEEAALLADEPGVDEDESLNDNAPESKALSRRVAEAKVDTPVEKPAKSTETAKAEQTEDATPEVKPSGDTRAALRAARRGEQRAKAEVNAMREELTTLRAKVPTQPSDGMTEAELDELALTYPVQAKALRAMRVIEAAQQTQQARVFEPEFEPMVLPPDMQEVVDDIPELLNWQNDKDQSKFELAVASDSLLLTMPKWRAVSQAERFAEVVRRVNAESDPQTTDTKPRANVKDSIASATRVKPNTLSDIGSGGNIQKPASNLSRFEQMSDQDIENELLSG